MLWTKHFVFRRLLGFGTVIIVGAALFHASYADNAYAASEAALVESTGGTTSGVIDHCDETNHTDCYSGRYNNEDGYWYNFHYISCDATYYWCGTAINCVDAWLMLLAPGTYCIEVG